MTQATSIHPTNLLRSLLASAAPVRTPAFTDVRRRTLPGSVAAMETVTIGGVAQRLWFRGSSREDPALIFLHGGLVSYWDREAETYDTPCGWTLRHLHDPSRPWVCSRARGTTLEVAIGTAANLPHYPDDVDLTGVDWSARMLDSARWRAQRMGRAVTRQQADAAVLPFPLRPGGSLLLADHVVATH